MSATGTETEVDQSDSKLAEVRNGSSSSTDEVRIPTPPPSPTKIDKEKEQTQSLVAPTTDTFSEQSQKEFRVDEMEKDFADHPSVAAATKITRLSDFKKSKIPKLVDITSTGENENKLTGQNPSTSVETQFEIPVCFDGAATNCKADCKDSAVVIPIRFDEDEAIINADKKPVISVNFNDEATVVPVNVEEEEIMIPVKFDAEEAIIPVNVGSDDSSEKCDNSGVEEDDVFAKTRSSMVFDDRFNFPLKKKESLPYSSTVFMDRMSMGQITDVPEYHKWIRDYEQQMVPLPCRRYQQPTAASMLPETCNLLSHLSSVAKTSSQLQHVIPAGATRLNPIQYYFTDNKDSQDFGVDVKNDGEQFSQLEHMHHIQSHQNSDHLEERWLQKKRGSPVAGISPAIFIEANVVDPLPESNGNEVVEGRGVEEKHCGDVEETQKEQGKIDVPTAVEKQQNGVEQNEGKKTESEIGVSTVSQVENNDDEKHSLGKESVVTDVEEKAGKEKEYESDVPLTSYSEVQDNEERKKLKLSSSQELGTVSVVDFEEEMPATLKEDTESNHKVDTVQIVTKSEEEEGVFSATEKITYSSMLNDKPDKKLVENEFGVLKHHEEAEDQKPAHEVGFSSLLEVAKGSRVEGIGQHGNQPVGRHKDTEKVEVNEDKWKKQGENAEEMTTETFISQKDETIFSAYADEGDGHTGGRMENEQRAQELNEEPAKVEAGLSGPVNIKAEDGSPLSAAEGSLLRNKEVENYATPKQDDVIVRNDEPANVEPLSPEAEKQKMEDIADKEVKTGKVINVLSGLDTQAIPVEVPLPDDTVQEWKKKVENEEGIAAPKCLTTENSYKTATTKEPELAEVEKKDEVIIAVEKESKTLSGHEKVDEEKVAEIKTKEHSDSATDVTIKESWNEKLPSDAREIAAEDLKYKDKIGEFTNTDYLNINEVQNGNGDKRLGWEADTAVEAMQLTSNDSSIIGSQQPLDKTTECCQEELCSKHVIPELEKREISRGVTGEEVCETETGSQVESDNKNDSVETSNIGSSSKSTGESSDITSDKQQSDRKDSGSSREVTAGTTHNGNIQFGSESSEAYNEQSVKSDDKLNAVSGEQNSRTAATTEGKKQAEGRRCVIL